MGLLQYDVCITNINASIDSENALCSCEADRVAIHAAIKALSLTGFDDINKGVELIRLLYLLGYPVHKIKGGLSNYSEIDKKKRRREAVVTHLVPSITTMLERIYSIAPSEVPSFKTVESQLGSSEPIKVFLEWKKIVWAIIEEKIQNQGIKKEFQSIKTS